MLTYLLVLRGRTNTQCYSLSKGTASLFGALRRAQPTLCALSVCCCARRRRFSYPRRAPPLHARLTLTLPNPDPHQALLILAARHHYTVDVVVALYTVPLLWSWWGHTFPDDLAPKDARIAAFVLGRDRERLITRSSRAFLSV